ncbi:hypothetical protein M758_UG032300 [Ceratodon purpureus]|nr:hypothetical protein M758_UG032300 [Ceratodon purpureus]
MRMPSQVFRPSSLTRRDTIYIETQVQSIRFVLSYFPEIYNAIQCNDRKLALIGNIAEPLTLLVLRIHGTENEYSVPALDHLAVLAQAADRRPHIHLYSLLPSTLISHRHKVRNRKAHHLTTNLVKTKPEAFPTESNEHKERFQLRLTSSSQVLAHKPLNTRKPALRTRTTQYSKHQNS